MAGRDLLGGTQTVQPGRDLFGEPVTDQYGVGLVDQARQGLDDLRRSFTGEGRYDEDLPELSGYAQAGPGQDKYVFQEELALAHDNPAKEVEIFRRRFPDTPMELDRYGNVIVEMGGKRQFLNKPGLSWADVSRGGVNATHEVLGAYIGAKLGGPLGWTGRTVGTGVGTAAASALEDKAAGFEIDEERAKMLGALAIAGEIAAPAVAWVLNKVVSKPVFVNANGQLTDQGRKVLRKFGVNPDEVTEAFVNRWQQQMQRQVAPDEALRYAESSSLPVEVPITRGGLTQNPSDLRTEAAARANTMGDPAYNVMKESDAATNRALQANVGLIDDMTSRGSRMGDAQRVLAAQRDALKAEVNAAYNTAREQGTSVLQEGAEGLSRHMRDRFAGRTGAGSAFNPRTAKNVAGMLDDFEADFVTAAAGKGRVAFKVNALENWRQQMATAARSADPVEKAAAKSVLRGYDDFMENMLDEALIRGSDDAINAFKRARSLRSRMFRNYESNKLVAKIIETESGELIRPPEEAARLLFGASDIGARNGAARAAKKLRELLPPEAWQGVKGEAFAKLLRSQLSGNDVIPMGVAEEGVEQVERAFSGSKFSSALTKALTDSPTLMAELFSAKEIGLLKQFARVAVRATKQMNNPPRTAHFITDAMARIFGPTAQWAQVAIARFGQAFMTQRSLQRINAAVNAVPEPRVPSMMGLADEFGKGLSGAPGTAVPVPSVPRPGIRGGVIAGGAAPFVDPDSQDLYETAQRSAREAADMAMPTWLRRSLQPPPGR